MLKNNLIKNVAIILDFVVSIIAACLKNSAQEISEVLFMISAGILIVAVVCVVIDFASVKNKS